MVLRLCLFRDKHADVLTQWQIQIESWGEGERERERETCGEHVDAK